MEQPSSPHIDGNMWPRTANNFPYFLFKLNTHCHYILSLKYWKVRRQGITKATETFLMLKPRVRYVPNSNLPKLPGKNAPDCAIKSTDLDDMKCFSPTLNDRYYDSQAQRNTSHTVWVLQFVCTFAFANFNCSFCLDGPNKPTKRQLRI